MCKLIVLAAACALAACNFSFSGNSGNNNSASTTTANALPQGFPDADPAARGAACIVYLGMSLSAHVTPGGHDATSMQQSANQWRSSLITAGKMQEDEVNQLVGSTVNTLADTPDPQRDAASAWCIENVPAA